MKKPTIKQDPIAGKRHMSAKLVGGKSDLWYFESSQQQHPMDDAFDC